MKELTKIPWLERAIETNRFHAEKRRVNSKWLIHDTARNLKRSLGSICEDLLIASWCKTHRPQLEKFDYAKDALEFIREKKEQMKLDEV